MNKKSTKYALIESVIQSWNQGEETIQENIKDETERKRAENFIERVTIAFTHNEYYYLKSDNPQKKYYEYSEDFKAIVLTLSKICDEHNLNCYILPCKKLTISYKDMCVFFCALKKYQCNFSSDLINRIETVIYALSLINHLYPNKFRKFFYKNNKDNNLNDDILKNNLLLYIISEIDYTKIKMTEKLTLSELIKKLEQSH